MMTMQFFDLVCEALPEDVQKEELTVLGKPEWWQERQYLACAYALRKCARINWKAYLSRYPDVAALGMDPVLHFLRHGVYEGRKIFSNLSDRYSSLSSSLKVSVIIPNYNNGIYLRKCLTSVMGQTLKSIEIIVVDDGSTDDSAEIIKEMERQDDRIRSIIFDENKSQHMARKAGVAIARGNYVMFLDPDDTYQPNACEVAYGAISKGYDIVSFNKNVINLVNLNADEVAASYKPYTRARNGLHKGDTLLENTFINNNLLYSLVTKIFDRTLIQKAFEELEDGYFLPLEDAYAMLPIMHMARNLYKIPDRLYNHTTGAGTSTYHGSDEETLRRFRMGRMIEAAKRYCDKNELDLYFEKFKLSCFNNVTGTIPLMGYHLARALINNLIENYGLLWSVCNLARIYKNSIGCLEKVLDARCAVKSEYHQIKNIAITTGKIESESLQFVQAICERLPAHNYKISIITTDEVSKNIFGKVLIHNIGKYESENSDYLENLHHTLEKNMPDLVVFVNPAWPALPMQLLLLRFMNIPAFVFIPEENGIVSMEKSQTERIKILRCIDKAICTSRSMEMYLRSLGIDAACLAQPATFVDDGDRSRQGNATESDLGVFEEDPKLQFVVNKYIDLLKTFAIQSEVAPYIPRSYRDALDYLVKKAGQ